MTGEFSRDELDSLEDEALDRESGRAVSTAFCMITSRK
jgi:hypothetical protein